MDNNSDNTTEKQAINTPEIIAGSIIMTEANQPIAIHSGEFKLKTDEAELQVSGEIEFRWFPTPKTVFIGSIEMNFDSLSTLNSKKFELIINEAIFGHCFLTSKTFASTSSKIPIEGVVTGYAIQGDKSIPVSKIQFAIPNLREFHGSFVKVPHETNIIEVDSRLTFEDTDYEILIDKVIDFKDRQKELHRKGGYVILYHGTITNKRGSLSFSDVGDVFNCFSTFLSFLNGRRSAPLFKQGIHNSEILWTEYSSYKTDMYEYSTTTWPPKLSTSNFDSLWQKFRSIWKNDKDKDFLIYAIHWYVEANAKTGLVEGAIVLAQTALELIYNWLLIEKKKLLDKSDATSISAANKIRLLLFQINVSQDIPASLTHLHPYATSNGIADGPESFVRVRNAIVHSQVEKREMLAAMNYSVKNEALELGIWYIELCILFILEYNGEYYNRCSQSQWAGEGEELTPWSKNKTM